MRNLCRQWPRFNAQPNRRFCKEPIIDYSVLRLTIGSITQDERGEICCSIRFFFTVYLILLARTATSRIGKTTTTQLLFRLPILALVLQMSGRFTLDKFCFYDSRAPQISCCRILNGCFWYVVHMAYIYERHPLVRCIYSLSTY